MKKSFALRTFLTLAVVVSVPLTSAAERARVGPGKCKMCHKVEFDSWSKTTHAAAKPAVDCETCHGNGGDYWTMKVMKDPVASKAAGLVARPDKASCTAECHKPADITDEMLAAVHARKPKKK